MSKKITAPKKTAAKAKPAKADDVVATTPVRYSALPKLTPAAPPAAAPAEVTFDRIAAKAYELFAAGREGGQLDHWLAAEAELRAAA